MLRFTTQEKSRDEVYEAALNAAEGSVFFPCSGGEGEGGVFDSCLPTPSPYEVDLGRKEPKTWDAEITRDTNKEVYTFGDPRAAASRTDYYRGILFFFQIRARSVSSGGKKEYKRTGNNRSILYSLPPLTASEESGI